MASRQRIAEGDSQKAAGGVKGANGGSSRILGWFWIQRYQMWVCQVYQRMITSLIVVSAISG